MKKVLVMPGAAAQIPLLKKIKAMGLESYSVNPYPDSPGFAYSTGHLQSDIFDFKKCLEYAEQLKVDAVVSDQCDIASGPVAKLAKTLELPGNQESVIALFRDKSAMRRYSRENNFNCPEFRNCHTLSEALDFFHELAHKMIIKPLDSNSSRGVFTITCDKDLEEHFAETQEWSISDKAVLCERFIEGTEFTIDGIKIPGHPHRCLAISEKRHFAHNRNIASMLYFSHENAHYDYEELRRLNDSYVDNSGLEFGLTHAEYKCEDGKFFLIEIGARGGGNYISSHIVPCMSGIDNMGILIRMALGEKIDPAEVKIHDELQKRCAVLEFFDFAPGRVKSIMGEDILKNDPRVLDYHFNFSAGDTIQRPADDSKRAGYYIAYDINRQALDNFRKEIAQKVSLVYF